MKKILFYTNDFMKLKNLPVWLDKLHRDGWEVAFSTDNFELLKFLSVKKLLVVTLDSYYPDFIVSDTKIKGNDVLSFKKFEEVVL